MLVFADGRIVGTIGGGCYENDAFWKAREALESRKPQLVHYELTDDFAQETGLDLRRTDGRVHRADRAVAASSTSSAPATSASTSARLAHDVGFRVHVVDDREKFANAERFPAADEIVVDDIPTWLAPRRDPRARLRRHRHARAHATISTRCARSRRATCATSA